MSSFEPLNLFQEPGFGACYLFFWAVLRVIQSVGGFVALDRKRGGGRTLLCLYLRGVEALPGCIFKRGRV